MGSKRRRNSLTCPHLQDEAPTGCAFHRVDAIDRRRRRPQRWRIVGEAHGRAALTARGHDDFDVAENAGATQRKAACDGATHVIEHAFAAPEWFVSVTLAVSQPPRFAPRSVGSKRPSVARRTPRPTDTPRSVGGA